MGKKVKRFRKRNLEEVFSIAYLKYSYYFSPQGDRPVSLDNMIDYLVSKRDSIDAFPS